jgi:hypothetical protein
MGKKDALWKGLLEEIFDDLLRFLFVDAEQVFDFGRGFEFLDKELLELYPESGEPTDTRFVDKLVKVYQRNGSERWILCHVEVQGYTNDRAKFTERMFRYYYRIFDRCNVPITAVAIFTGKDNKRMPDRHVQECMGTELTYRYNTLRLE